MRPNAGVRPLSEFSPGWTEPDGASLDAVLKRYPQALDWAAGQGVVRHTPTTQAQIVELARTHLEASAEGPPTGDGPPLFELLRAADTLTNAGLWLVVHQVYARRVPWEGPPLGAEDFKAHPDGHSGGSLNMVPAYVGYLLANAISGRTRSWIMGQGHCVAAIDAVNVLVGNLYPDQAERYPLSEAGLGRYVRDFYNFELSPQAQPVTKLASHTTPHTAGGLAEGGYLGFVQLQYMHMPLPGESLVAFLSDGAFEEQRGGDWAPRWWRARDCGAILPVMIANGRRIDQRTITNQQGGPQWFLDHLRLNHFDPIVIDGRDPAAFAWAFLYMEQLLAERGRAAEAGEVPYPIELPYLLAVAPKGAGFFNEGTKAAHNVPLGKNLQSDPKLQAEFRECTDRFAVTPELVHQAVNHFQQHAHTGRPPERHHPLAERNVQLNTHPQQDYTAVRHREGGPARWHRQSPMQALDRGFVTIVEANPELRVRVGNPDEMDSNRLSHTLELLKFRVTDPEFQQPEAVYGQVISALNEEAVAGAALGNQGGLNLLATYESFGSKIYGELREAINWAWRATRSDRPPRWLSVPIVLTSHTWENGKNELSHQNPNLVESLWGEPTQIGRVLFPPDANTAVATLAACYRTQGQYWTMVVSKAKSVADLLTEDDAMTLLHQGAMALPWAGFRGEEARLVLTAIGSAQLEQALRASRRLTTREIPHKVIVMQEPSRFRKPRREGEAQHLVCPEVRQELYPPHATERIFLTHTRPEPLLGLLQPLSAGATLQALGFLGQGGTLSLEGMLFVNRCTWAHAVQAAAERLEIPRQALLDDEERAALDGQRSPHEIIIGPVTEM